jgi:hypothetical protein
MRDLKFIILIKLPTIVMIILMNTIVNMNMIIPVFTHTTIRMVMVMDTIIRMNIHIRR